MASGDTYTNPVHPAYMADPFVLKFNGEYYAYGTAGKSGSTVPVLHSVDLVHWQDRGMALEPLENPELQYWAPEVAYDNGTFYMYYSAGGREGEGHQLHVATAEHPAGPFRDSGRILTPDDPFTIDAHPFRDDDGTWYMFYCHDFLEGDRPGTGILVDRMVDMVTLAGEPQTVVRPHAEWNLYQRQRLWYERVWDWYTIEGAFVRKYDNRYYCFYSGGAWREPNYGVGCAVADHPMGPYKIETSVASPELLRTIPGRIIGPGHMSIAVAPDNLHEYIVYHAWDPEHTGRLMRIDPLIWSEHGPTSSGPSLEVRPAPPLPQFRDPFGQPDGAALEARHWHITGGRWQVQSGEAQQADSAAIDATAILHGAAPRTSYLLEANLKLLEPGGEQAALGVYVAYTDPDNYVALELLTEQPALQMVWRTAGQITEQQSISLAPLGSRFRADTYHQMLVERQGHEVRLRIDGVPLLRRQDMPAYAAQPGLFTRNAAAAFDGIALTVLDTEEGRQAA